jgi:hypothetical protein
MLEICWNLGQPQNMILMINPTGFATKFMLKCWKFAGIWASLKT